MAVRIVLSEQRRRQMEIQLPVTLELGLQLGEERRVRLQPRDLVFVLVGHQFVKVARHGFGQRLAQAVAVELTLGFPHRVDN